MSDALAVLICVVLGFVGAELVRSIVRQRKKDAAERKIREDREHAERISRVWLP